MKQLLYVYVPGFEYDSKGPLHIDAIRLDVTTGAIERDEKNNIVNSLPTYIYIPPLNKKGNYDPENELIYGNIIYRTSSNHFWYPDITDTSGRFKNAYDPSYNPSWTEKEIIITNPLNQQVLIKKTIHDRVLHGYFYDFITTPKDSEVTHHVIGIHGTPNDCLTNVSNLDVKEHDGLFVVLIEELNTELVFNFTFYSRINQETVLSDNIEVGKQESILLGIPGSPLNDFDFFIQEKVTKDKFGKDFFDEYIEIGKWELTYNPATSGIEESSIQTSNLRNQYFDLETWGTEDHEWEIPVNAGMLISNMGDPSYLKEISGSKPVWKLFKYDNDKESLTYRQHICDNSLKCNSSSYSTYGDFYTNFYEGGIKTVTAGQNIDAQYKGKAVFAKRFTWSDLDSSLFNFCQTVNCFNINSSEKAVASYEYLLSNVNLNNLSYLYKNPIYVTINNLAHDYLVGNTADLDLIVISLDHCGRNSADATFQGGVLDLYNYNLNRNGHDDWEYWYKSYFTVPSTDVHINIYEKLPGINKREVPLSDNTLSMYYEKERETSYNNKTIENYLKEYYNNRPNPSIADGGFKSSYLATVKELTVSSGYYITSESILNTGEKQIFLTDNSKLGIYIDVSSVSFPVIAYDSMVYRSIDDRYYGSEINKYYNKPLSWNNTFTSSIKSRGIGTVTVFLPQMFQINLDPTKTNITKTNLADYKIVPMLVIDSNGYSKGVLIPVNVDITNLLDPSPDTPDPEPNSHEDSGYELLRVLNNDSNLKITTELDYKDALGAASGKIKTKYNSSFCNEKRFIGKNTTNISVEKEISLTKGLYIFKIQNMYPKEDTGITIDYTFDGTRFEDVSGYYNKWVFLVNTAGTFKLHNIKRSENSWKNSDKIYDVISGIGLYKVNLDNKDTNTQILNSTVSELNINGFLQSTDSNYISIYNLIIFPVAFCALENIHFCNKLGAYAKQLSYREDYLNDYCVNVYDDPIYHYYNFKYLPSKAVYDVLAYYTIPSGNELRIDLELILLITDLFDAGKLSFLRSQIVRI